MVIRAVVIWFALLAVALLNGTFRVVVVLLTTTAAPCLMGRLRGLL